MRYLAALLVASVFTCANDAAHAQNIPVERFHKVIISPYIQATFVEGPDEGVTINSMIVDTSLLHVEVHHGTLRLYLEGAKDIPHNQQNIEGRHLYPDHAVLVTVRYRKLNSLSLRGSERYLFESPLATSDFWLRLYGDTKMIFTEVHVSRMHAAIYGESTLDIRSGDVTKQYYTCFGEGKVYSSAIAGRAARVTAFGEGEFYVNVSDRIKVTAFGEARLRYLGNPNIVKGIHFGEVDVKRLD